MSSIAEALALPLNWRAFAMSRPNRPDGWLLFAAFGLLAIGVVMVLNASFFFAGERFGQPYLFFYRHLFYLTIGLLLGIAASWVRTDLLERWAYWFLLVSFLLVVAVLIPGIGVIRGGARRWINLGLLSFQPAEFVKIALVLYLARSISRKGSRLQGFFGGLLPHLIVTAVFVGLIILQPDFGTVVILSLVTLSLLLVGGARLRHVVGPGLLALPLAIVAVAKSPYRLQRVLCFVDPWQDPQHCGFQLVQSLIALGSGGLTGVGLGESRQKLFFLPEAHTDFIFALVGEELGLVGMVAVISLFLLLGARGFRIARRHPEPFGSLLAFGITLTIVLEATINIGVVVGLLPTKGLALPFLSYGGSALIVVLTQVGILAGLSRSTG